MSYHQNDRSDAGYAQNSFEDPDFQPQADFNFEQPHEQGRGVVHDARSSHGSNILHADYKMERGISDDHSQRGPYQGMDNSFSGYASGMSGSNVDPSQIWGEMDQQMMGSYDGNTVEGAPFPKSGQTEIVKEEGSGATQNFGRFTPPKSNTPDKRDDGGNEGRGQGPDPVADAGGLDRSARARKAANQRHAMSKKVGKGRQGSQSGPARPEKTGNGDVRDDDDDENKREKYRERNRVAAAKCRAKKKQSVGGLEEIHRQELATNNFMRRQVMSLRDELSAMRTQALLHDDRDGRCRCEGIHQYNHNKAMELTMSRFGPGQSSLVGGGDNNTSEPGMLDDPRRMSTTSQQFQGQNFGYQTANDQHGRLLDDDEQFARYMQSSGDGSGNFAFE